MLHFLSSLNEVFFVLLLIRITVIDIQAMRIPDRLNGAVLLLGLLQQVVLGLSALPGAGAAEGFWLSYLGGIFSGLLAAALPMYLLAVAFPGSLGGGDIKLAAAAGVFLGATGVLRGTAIGLVLAGAYGAAVLLAKKKAARQTFPLGPFLSAGYMMILCSAVLLR